MGEAPAALARGEHALEGGEPHDRVHVHVRADEGHAVADEPVDYPGGAVGDVVQRVAALDLPHDRDGLLEEVRRVLARAVGGERLVEVDVRLDEGWRREAPAGVDLARGAAGEAGLDPLDAPLGDADVHEVGVVAAPGSPDDQVHGLRCGLVDSAGGRAGPRGG